MGDGRELQGAGAHHGGRAGPGEASDEVRLARAGLLRACEPPAPAVWDLVAKVGPVQAWRAIREHTAAPAVLRETAARTEHVGPDDLVAQAERDLGAAAACGARLVVPEDEHWPDGAASALALAHGRGAVGAVPPLALYLRGALPRGLPYGVVTVVGSRAGSPYGMRVAADLANGLATEGYVVVSGAAFGIDAAAHRAALEAAGSTVAVLACGIDRSYPSAHRPLLDRIADDGAVITEYPPGLYPARHRFLVRNRLVAALGAATVVVEAGRRSGALNTATAAAVLGRQVFAIPGPVTSAVSVGCHYLIAAGKASLATGVEDVLAEIRPLDASPEDAVSGEARVTDDLDADTARVYDALPARGERTVEQVAAESAVPSREVLPALALLAVHGLVERRGSLWRRARAGDACAR